MNQNYSQIEDAEAIQRLEDIKLFAQVQILRYSLQVKEVDKRLEILGAKPNEGIN